MTSFLVALIVLLPLLSAIFLGLLYLYCIKIKKVPNWLFDTFGLSAPFLSFLITLYFLPKMIDDSEKVFFYTAYKWLSIYGYDINMGFMLDRLSLFMAMFITFVGWLIHIYASGYMRSDSGYGKFFFYFNLFLASMLLLVLADSPLIMFIGWEGVGVCSYFLISYYYKDAQNVKAGNKAFIVNRVGDFGFVVALITLFYYAGANGFDYKNLAIGVQGLPIEVLTFIGMSLFIGAIGKSAQIPLHVWLPDAMAGPTPVSALIHAATMVTAGVYMVVRFSFLYDLIPSVGVFISYIGAFSALFAALIATKQTDIKKILAYSTMSQLGYMFMAVGLGSYSVGIFHVFTHAFFKALLFMGAGAIIVALNHEQNIFKMGGLKKRLPLVCFTMLIATLAISGIPPFAGFFSKDEILLSAFANQKYVIWLLGLITAFFTSYYMFRLFFIVFFAKNCKYFTKLQTLSRSMKIPLIVLAFGSLFSGFIGIPKVLGGSNFIGNFLNDWNLHVGGVSHTLELGLMGLNILIALVGIAVAYKKFFQYDLTLNPELKGVIWHKFYVDEIYERIFIRGIKKLSIFFTINIDKNIIDRLVMSSSLGFIKMGWVVSKMQSAVTRYYAIFMMIGVSIISIYLLIVLGYIL